MNITITLTEEELHAFLVTKRMMDEMEYSNLALDEELGQDLYKRVHEGLDSLEEKVEDEQWIEEWVAEGKEARPDLSRTVIRKYAKKALKAQKEG